MSEERYDYEVTRELEELRNDPEWDKFLTQRETELEKDHANRNYERVKIREKGRRG